LSIRCIDILQVHFEHADYMCRSSDCPAAARRCVGILRLRAACLVRIYEQRRERRIGCEIVAVDFERAAKFGFRGLRVHLKSVDPTLQKVQRSIFRLRRDCLVDVARVQSDVFFCAA
jgi:hypothetical protein